MVSKPYKKRFLRNTNTNEIHDTSNEKDGCNLDQIKDENAEWYDSKEQAKASSPDTNLCNKGCFN